MANPEFWASGASSQGVLAKGQDDEGFRSFQVAKFKAKRLNELKERKEKWEKLSQEIDDLLEIASLDKEAKDVDLRKEIEKRLKELKKQFESLELFIFLRKKYDKMDAILSIHAGAGGVDAQDWAEMLLRMYQKFSEKKAWQIKVIDESRGGEAGIKSAVLEIQGPYAYGYLKAEAGVHRLVRISPFDAEKMRHTSFALVEVLPEMGETEEIKIRDEDLRIDTFLSSGPGGQKMQKTESAVRIIHLPTKIMVSCQSERSQARNKETALKILKSKLVQYNLAQKEEEKARLRGQFQPAEWGHQIRSYVLHPYKMVKDHRTGYETSDVEGVLEGELQELIEAWLRINCLIPSFKEI